jgi:2-haloacid dehalogenase
MRCYQSPLNPDASETFVTVDYDRFEALTFDCYGTLIDWETGLLRAFAPVLAAHGVTVDDEDLLVRYAAHEARLEAGPYLRYRDLLATALRGVGDELGFQPSDEEAAHFGGSVADWPAFADASTALARLHDRFRLGVLTNCDDDLFAASNARLAVDFDWIVTAEQVGSYKPSVANFEALFARLAADGVARDRVLHVAQSRFHDHAPAKRLGMTTVWIDRRHDRPGAGATPPAAAAPDATFSSMAAFAAQAVRSA